jgi:hypothetical protein
MAGNTMNPGRGPWNCAAITDAGCRSIRNQAYRVVERSMAVKLAKSVQFTGNDAWF